MSDWNGMLESGPFTKRVGDRFMPMHNWKKVRAGIYHAFHHGWIHEIARSLNQALPKEYYALPEQTTAGFGPDVLTLQGSRPDDDDEHSQNGTMATATSVRLRPKTRFMVETDVRFFERKKKRDRHSTR